MGVCVGVCTEQKYAEQMNRTECPAEDTQHCTVHKCNEYSETKTATCGPALTDLYREVAALQR